MSDHKILRAPVPGTNAEACLLGPAIEMAFADATRKAIAEAWARGVPVSTLNAHGQVVWVYPDGSTKLEFALFTPAALQTA